MVSVPPLALLPSTQTSRIMIIVDIIQKVFIVIGYLRLLFNIDAFPIGQVPPLNSLLATYETTQLLLLTPFFFDDHVHTVAGSLSTA